jgi:carbon-monoxide dehydrogenase large subunit
LANVVGQRIRRREDPRFITGQGRYVDDIKIPGALHVTFVRSPWAHAKINAIDASAARALPGVHVFTAQDIELDKEPLPPFLPFDERWHRPFLASEKVRWAGEIVAAVLAETRERSVDAAELVEVEYEPLPVVTDAVEAAKNEVLLFEETGTNVCLEQPGAMSDEELFAGCEAIASGTLTSQRIAACPIEPRAAAARVEDDDRLTVWLSTQTPHQDRDGLSVALGLDPAQIRVLAPDVGGGFGGKGLVGEYVLVAYLARKTGAPVRWTETRTENLIALPHGRAQRIDFRIGGRRDGTIEALRLTLTQDAGAYPGVGAILVNLTGMMASGVYRIPRIAVELRSVVTNTATTAAVRGAGRPEATQGVERAIDAFAAELELDPAEIRRRNFIPNEAFPYQTATGINYDIGDYGGALDRVLEVAGYEQLRAEQAARLEGRDGVKLLGIGISAYVEITNGLGEQEFGGVEITAEGQAIVRTGSFSQGQGHETTFAQIVAERLGLPVDQVTVVKGDTDTVARGTGTYGSKSTQIGGVAAGQASEEVVERGKRLAAEELEASAEDMVLDLEQGRFHVAGSPEPGLNWQQLAERLVPQNRLQDLSAEADYQAPQPTFPFGAHLAVVEVDADTGSVSLERFVAVDDAGRIINPLVFEGQVHGGLAHGIAQALFEEIAYDEDGNPLNANLVSYCIPGPTELPSFELVDMETPTPVNPLGAKGIGEAGTIGATPAVHAAVLDALKPLGVKELEMPLGSERVWRAIQQAATRQSR